MKPAVARMALASILNLAGRALDTWLADHRRGLEPCPSDQDWLAALLALPAGASREVLRAQAVQAAATRLVRRRVVAARQRRKRADKLRATWQMGRR